MRTLSSAVKGGKTVTDEVAAQLGGLEESLRKLSSSVKSTNDDDALNASRLNTITDDIAVQAQNQEMVEEALSAIQTKLEKLEKGEETLMDALSVRLEQMSTKEDIGAIHKEIDEKFEEHITTSNMQIEMALSSVDELREEVEELQKK